MKFEMIEGFRKRSRLLHVPDEKMLYVSKCRRRGREEFICYQTILSAEKKNNEIGGSNKNHQKCTARVFVADDEKEICSRNTVSHTNHVNHEEIVQILETTNNIKDKCLLLQKNFPGYSRKISAKDIFYDELAK